MDNHEVNAVLPAQRKSTHPGEILLKEFLKPLRESQSALAQHLGVSKQRINESVRGRRRMTPSIAWLLSQAFITTPEFWMNLQISFDLSSTPPAKPLKRLVE